MTDKKRKALAALIRAPTRAAAAKEAGVGISTLRRWMKDDIAFRREYNAALSELLEDANAQARKSMAQAMDVLTEIMASGENSSVRVTAARTALEYSLKLTEAVDIVSRMDKIEATLKEAEVQSEP